jgi:hypothetical protein
LGPSRGHLGHLGPSAGRLGPFWDHLGVILAILGRIGAILGSFRAILGLVGLKFRSTFVVRSVGSEAQDGGKLGS